VILEGHPGLVPRLPAGRAVRTAGGPGHHRGEPIVAVGGAEVLDEALRVEHYPGGDLLG